MSEPATAIETPTNTPAVVKTATTSAPSDGGDIVQSAGVVVKPGMKTSEFAITMLIVIGGLVMGSPLLTNNTAIQITGLVVATLKAGMYTWSRTQLKTMTMLALIVLFAHTQVACASSAREKTLGYTLASLDAAAIAVDVYQRPHELAIVAACDPAKPKADCEAQVAAFQADRDKAKTSLKAALDLVGKAWKLNDDPSLASAVAAASNAYALAKSLGVSL